MAKKQIQFVVITPERQALEETTNSMVIPAHDGEIGILPDRAPLMCELGVGQLRYQKDGRTRRMFIESGFAQVNRNQVTVLTNHAVAAEDVTPALLADAEKTLQAAQGQGLEAVEARQNARRKLNVLRAIQTTA